MTTGDDIKALEYRIQQAAKALSETGSPEVKKLYAGHLELLIDRYKRDLQDAIISRVHG